MQFSRQSEIAANQSRWTHFFVLHLLGGLEGITGEVGIAMGLLAGNERCADSLVQHHQQLDCGVFPVG